MVIIVYGTSGEYIKLFPLIEKLGPDNCVTINVNMQPEQMKQIFATSTLPKPDIVMLNGYKDQDINTIPKMFAWVWQLIHALWKLRKTVRQYAKQEPTIFIVHGDTIITPIGTIFGKYVYRLPVGHIEAAYRSGTWREPFPEELDRIITDKLASVNYADGEKNIENIRPPITQGRIVDIKHNTIMDALQSARQAPPTQQKFSFKLPAKYILVSMHRSEAISKKTVMTELVEELASTAKNTTPVVWLDHPPTQEKLTQYGLDDTLASKNITRIPKQPYFTFINIVSRADGIITDSGGLQEEAYLLGIPCLIHRMVNEKAHMGVLSHFKRSEVAKFLQSYKKLATKQHTQHVSPSQIVFDDLKKHGFVHV